MIADIIDEQNVADLLQREEQILDSASKMDPANQIHIAGAHMAAEISEYLSCVQDNLSSNGHDGAATYVRLLQDYARQLQAHHLDFLDRAQPGRANAF